MRVWVGRGVERGEGGGLIDGGGFILDPLPTYLPTYLPMCALFVLSPPLLLSFSMFAYFDGEEGLTFSCSWNLGRCHQHPRRYR